MSRISTGTVSVDAGGTVVTVWLGDGGVFLSNITAPSGSQIVIDGVANFIKERLSTTSVELVMPHAGAGGDDLPCAISALTPSETSVATLNARTASFVQQLSVLDANGRGLFYNLIGVTGDNDPGPGNIAQDNVAPELVTEIYLDVLDANEGGRDVSGLIGLWQAKTIVVVRSLASTAYAAYRLTGAPEQPAGYRRLAVEYVGHDGALSDEPVAVEWRLAGADRDVDQTVNVIADRAAFDDELAGFSVLVSGPGRAARYTRLTDVPGVWSAPAYYTGEPSTVPGPVGVNWRPAWDAITTYALRDGVEDNGSSWRSLQDDNLNHAPPVLPSTSNAWWTLIARKGTDGTGTGDMVGPAGAVDGNLAVFNGTTGKQTKDGGKLSTAIAERSDMFRGFGFSMNVANPTTHIDIAAGMCRDSLNLLTIETTSSMTKRINANWAAGTGNGFLDTGVVGNGVHYIHAIFNPATEASDFIASTSLTAPVLPSGWAARRLLGAFVNNIAGIYPFVQEGEWHWYKTRVASVSNAANTTAANLRSLLVPNGAKCEVEVYLQASATTAVPGWVVVRDPDLGTYTVAVAVADWFYAASEFVITRTRLRTDNLGRVSTGDTNASGTGVINIHVEGFRLDRSVYR